MGEVFRKVRVLHTFILQRITDSEDVEGRVEMQGTFVQRVLDLTKKKPKHSAIKKTAQLSSSIVSTNKSRQKEMLEFDE